MVTNTQIFQAINAVSKRVEEVNGRLDQVFRMLHDDNVANIDYLAMMTDTDLPSEDSDTPTIEEEE